MTSASKNVLLRAATAVIALPPVCALLHLGGPWAAILIGGASAICASEYLRMVAPLRLANGPSIAVAAWLGCSPLVIGAEAPTVAFYTIVVLAVAAWLLRLAGGAIAGAPEYVGHQLAAAMFAGGGLFALASIRTLPLGREWALALVVVTFANDTGAFATGKLFGRHKLAPRISPGKTWEGLAGGAVFSVAAALGVQATFFPAMTLADVAALAAITAVVGPIGDLVKSTLKRASGVKDAGRLLPGHGGLLDRIDALVMSALATWAYIGVP